MTRDDDARRRWFRERVLPVEPQLRRFAERFCHIAAGDAEDLVHETFARLITYDGWSEVENVQAFAYSTLRNVALQSARRKRVVSIHSIGDMESLDLADQAPDAARALEARDELRLLLELIETLPPQCRRAFKLRKIEELSYQEIADRLGLSISTVEKHIVRGLRLCSEGLASGTVAAKSRGTDGRERPHMAGTRPGGSRQVGGPPGRTTWPSRSRRV